MKSKIILCALCVLCGYSVPASNIIFTAKSGTNSPINPQIDIAAERGSPFVVGTNLIFASFSIQLTNGFYEVFGLAPNCYTLNIESFGAHLRMCVPNDTNTYNWTQLITNGVYPAQITSALVVTNESRVLDFSNTNNIFDGAVFSSAAPGAFQGDGSALTNLAYLPLSNNVQQITYGAAFLVYDGQLGHTRFRADSSASFIDDPSGVTSFLAASGQRSINDANGSPQVVVFTTNTFIHNDATFDTNITVGGNVAAATFTGSGAGLTGITSNQVPGLAGSNINSGTIATARLGSGSATSSTYLRGDQTWATLSGGSGTVTSISGPSIITWASSTTTPTGTLNTETSNTFLAGPASGSAAAPTFRALGNADLPATLAPKFSAANLTSIPAAQVTGALPYGLGVPQAVAAINQTGQTAADGSPVTLYTAPASGIYLVLVYLQITTSDTHGETLDVPLSYISLTGTQPADPFGPIPFSSTGDFQTNFPVYLVSGQALTYQRILSAPLIDGDYALAISVLRP